jgi:FixJ family two-component response regulator
MKAGVAAYLLKPVDEQVLLDTIADAAAGSSAPKTRS